MFFDRLFTLVSLKSRLLNSSSFSQIYSKERLSLRKFRVEGATLTPLIAGLLAACGGGPIPGPRTTETRTIRETVTIREDGGDGDTPVDTGRTTFDAVGSQIQNAKFYYDLDGDGVLDEEEINDENLLGTSGEDGRISVTNQALREAFEKYKNADGELGILANLSDAINRDTGEGYEDGTYFLRVITEDAVGTLKILSAITTILEKLIEADISAEDGGQRFWTLVDKRGSDGRSDDTALLMFRSAAFSSVIDDEIHPFADLTASSLFEFL